MMGGCCSRFTACKVVSLGKTWRPPFMEFFWGPAEHDNHCLVWEISAFACLTWNTFWVVIRNPFDIDQCLKSFLDTTKWFLHFKISQNSSTVQTPWSHLLVAHLPCWRWNHDCLVGTSWRGKTVHWPSIRDRQHLRNRDGHEVAKGRGWNTQQSV